MIEKLRGYCVDESFTVSKHANKRMQERGISLEDVISCILTGDIIESYPGDFPFPSFLVLGEDVHGDPLHVVMSSEGHLITTYRPDYKHWEPGFSKRRDNSG